MAKELMEIGGFITSGAEIVNHDNSLSGNGTVDSPLGVVPGYNETVLFSGVNAWGYGTIPLSEPLKNFQRIKVLATRAYSADNNTDRYAGPWCEFDCDGIANTTASWGSVTPAIYEAENWKYSVFTANSTFTELKWYKGGYINVQDLGRGNGSNWIDGKSVGIKAVIGINRKAQ